MTLISREAAIEAIESHLRVGDEVYPLTRTDKILNHAFEIAASCVYNLPTDESDEWCDNCKEYDHNKHCCPRFNRVIRETVEEVKQNAEQKWIPVSEAMPEESDGTVLVCMPNKFPYNEKEPFVNAKHNRQVETATYSQHSDTWHYTNGGVKSTRPIAWMPLPEPYQKEGD